MKKATIFLLTFIGLAVLVVLLILVMRYRAQGRLAAYENELRAAGEKLDISDLTPTPDSQGQKKAVALLQAANRLTAVIDFYPNGMSL